MLLARFGHVRHLIRILRYSLPLGYISVRIGVFDSFSPIGNRGKPRFCTKKSTGLICTLCHGGYLACTPISTNVLRVWGWVAAILELLLIHSERSRKDVEWN